MKKNYKLLFAILLLFGFTQQAVAQCTTAANTYNNLANNGGAPCNDGTGCSVTDGAFVGFGIYGSEAYILPNVEAGFDYVFEMCSGFGAGAWVPEISIVSPSGTVDATNHANSGTATHAAQCSLSWTASESGQYTIYVNELGTFNGNAPSQTGCNNTLATDNGNPTVTCGVNAFSCILFDANASFATLAEYGSVPLSQVQTYNPSLQVVNDGVNAMSGVSVAFTVTNGATSVYNTTVNYPGSVPSGDTVTVTDAGAGFTPVDTGVYVLQAVVSITQADGNAANDTFRTALIVDESLYARDFAVIDGSAPNALGIGAGGTGIFGNVYEVVSPITANSIDFFLTGAMAIGDTVRGYIYNMAGNTPTTVVDQTVEYIVTAADTPLTNLELVFPTAPTLNAGNYLFAIEEYATVDNIGCLTSPQLYTLNKSLGSVNGNPFADIASLGVNPQVFLIRANMSAPASGGFDASNLGVLITEYSAIPLSQVENYKPTAFVLNDSTSDITNVTATVEILDGTLANVLYTASMDTTALLQPDSIAELNDSGAGFTPTVTDRYFVRSIVSITENDAVATNDTFLTAFDVTDSLYSRDFFDLNSNAVTGAWGVGTGTADFGNMFSIVNNTNLVSVTGVLNGALAIGDTVKANLFAMAGNVPGAFIASSQELIVTAADTPVFFQDFIFPTNPLLTAGNDYFVAVEQYASTGTRFGILSTGNIYTPDASFFRIDGGVWAEVSQTTVGADPFMVRANVAPVGCSVISLAAGNQTACNTANDQFTQDIIVTYVNPPASGQLSVNGQLFNITSSPQTVTLTGLQANGAANDVIAFFTADNNCSLSQNNVFTAPASCACSITDIVAGNQSSCDPNTNEYTQDLTLYYINPPTTGSINVNGQTFPVGTSPQQVTLTGLTADGNNVNINASFSVGVCGFGVSPGFTAPASCGCSGYTVSASITADTCGQNTGVIDLTLVGGSGNVTYSWMPGGANTLDLTGVAAGTYSVTITDGNQCDTTLTYTVGSVSSSTSLGTSTTQVTNCSPANGTATVTINNAPAPTQIQWNDGAMQTTPTASSLGAGSYNVTVTDGWGCATMATANVTTQPGLGFTASVDNVVDVDCFNDGDGEIQVSVNGGSGNFTYQWSDQSFASTQDRNGLDGGTYSLQITDNTSGCTFSLNGIVVDEPTSALMASEGAKTDVNCNGGNNGSITASVTGGTMPYQYRINGGAYGSNASFAGLTAGVYTIDVLDNNGCSSSFNTTITEPTALMINASLGNDITCNNANDAVINANASGGNAPYTYSIDGVTYGNNNTFGSLGAGSYTVYVRDDNNCIVSINTPIAVTNPSVITLSAQIDNEIACNGDMNGQISVTNAAGGTGNLQFSIDGVNFGTNTTFGNLGQGNYTVTARDDNGCTATAGPFLLNEPAALDLSNIVATPQTSNTNPNGTATVLPTGGTSPYSYLWNDASNQATSSASGLVAGVYSVTVTDNNNCVQTASITVADSTTTSVSTLSLGNFSLSPNPANNAFTVSFETGSAANWTLKLIDNIGSVIETRNLNTTSTTINENFVVTDLASGVYTLFVSNENGVSAYKIIVSK